MSYFHLICSNHVPGVSSHAVVAHFVFMSLNCYLRNHQPPCSSYITQKFKFVRFLMVIRLQVWHWGTENRVSQCPCNNDQGLKKGTCR